MNNYSLFSLVRNALSGHRRWKPAWASPDPRKTYDVVIIGAGGQGLATAYFLANRYGVSNVAVIEKGWLGGGGSGRNTQVTRSNYFWPESAAFFDHSLKLYEQLGRMLNFNIMLSQRGVLNLAHSHHMLEQLRRWTNAIQLNGVDSEMVTPEEIARLEPLLEVNGRYPVVGGFIQRRGGISRHDAVVWAFARAASAAGVDIIQQTEVTGFDIDAGRVRGVETSRGGITAGKVCICVAGHTSVMANLAGFEVPVTSMALQAMLTEPVKPCLRRQLASPELGVYLGQSDRGEIIIGGSADRYVSYAQRGGLPILHDNLAATAELVPSFRRLRLMRQWAGTVDISPDTTPIMGYTPVQGLYMSGGWGTGGYKAIPAGGDTMAYTIANDTPHPLIEKFGLERFEGGHLIDEGAASGVGH